MSATKIQTFYENNIYFSKKSIIMLSKIMPSDLGHTILKFHFYVPDLGQTYAHRAKLCLRFRADFCTPEAIFVRFQTDFSTSGA